MLTIYTTTKYHDWLVDVIGREDRLHELVDIVDYLETPPVASGHNLIVRDDAIVPLLDWYDRMPPYLLAEKLELKPQYLLGLLFAKLGNYERVNHYLAKVDPALNHELDVYNRLQHGLRIDPGDLASSLDYYDEYRLMHNHAIVRHYGAEDSDAEQTKYYYLQALETAPSDEHLAFSARHFGLLLIDLGELEDADRVLRIGLAKVSSTEGGIALRHARCQAMLPRLQPPYDPVLLDSLKQDLSQVLTAYENRGQGAEAALVLLDAATLCHYEKRWSEGLGYITRAIELLEGAETEALLADAFLRKGALLGAWAQDGNPQFYRKAVEAYQRAVKTFSRKQAPLIYADIQQRLGLIYAEIPDDSKKKAMWAAVSSTAFQEALSILTKDAHPDAYATVCNHYGNALMKYPAAKLTDNVEKALYFYQEALHLRPAARMPLERSLTLLNYLEAQWHLGMPEDVLDLGRVADMEARAMEVIEISPDPQLSEAARGHLDRLGQLKTTYA